MGSEWKDCELGDVIEFKRGYDLPKTIRGAGDIPVISSSGKSGFHNEFKVMAPGVVTGRYGTIGEVFYLDTNFWPLNTTLYVCDFKGNDPLFIYYFLKTISYSDFIDKAAVPGINRNHIHKAKVKVPKNIDCQQKIAKTLKVLDNKISLNNQINQTLEQMAQTLFKSWFVDFDPVIDNALDVGFFERDLAFPKELLRRVEVRKVAREGCGFKSLPEDIRKLFPAAFEECAEPSLGLGGWVPEGWIYKTAENVANVSIGKTPPRKENEWFSEQKENNIVWISIRDMGCFGAYTGDSNEYLTQNAVEKFNIKKVPKDSVLLSFKLTLGRVTIASEELTTNEAIAHFVDPKYGISPFYLYCYLINFNYHSMGSTSSIATAVNSKIVKRMPILVPEENILNFFKKKTISFFEKIKSVDNESSTLTNLRDTLLPKLISGELSLSDIKIDSVDDTLA
ncbi:TPA: restriction endonuclease subunit S [Morganella morganii]